MSVESVMAALEPDIGPADAKSVRAVGGGSINASYAFAARDGARYFVKLNTADRLDMFTAERDGLLELAAAKSVRVPEPIATGTVGAQSYLLMESLELGGHSRAAAAELGRRLALQHRVVRDEFGWHRDNTIGSTPQLNDRSPDWIEFLRDRRLGYQLQLAARNGVDSRVAERGEELLERLPEFFADYAPVASVLHGDLWGGNWGITADGEPVIFDPAVYFGDREADIAMTMLFGGFGAEFLEAYQSEWPLDPGFRRRVDLYNLYHVLNHYNLFGGGYQQQAAAMLDGLLA
ncbi:MAG: fructosamine kinase family protein [Gammaproteobacteria bacterium]